MLVLAVSITLNVGAIASAFGSLAALFAAIGALSRLRPVRWLWRRIFKDPFTEWFRRQVSEVVDSRLDARPLLNGHGDKVIKTVEKVAEVLEVDLDGNVPKHR